MLRIKRVQWLQSRKIEPVQRPYMSCQIWTDWSFPFVHALQELWLFANWASFWSLVINKSTHMIGRFRSSICLTLQFLHFLIWTSLSVFILEVPIFHPCIIPGCFLIVCWPCPIFLDLECSLYERRFSHLYKRRNLRMNIYDC